MPTVTKIKKPRSSSYSRTKGHNLERFIVQYFKKLGYTSAMTARWGSRIMDDAKLDLCGIPFNVQCKAVEAHINYTTLIKEISDGVDQLVPERKGLPIIIIHKRKSKIHAIMDLENLQLLLEQIKK